jgi:prepilin-type N-terminal cleavage/methylation domain-containing protein
MHRFFSVQEEGFTLIEVMLGITIISVILIPVLYNFSYSTKIIHEIEISSQALKLLNNAIEMIKAEASNNWSNLDSYVNTITLEDIALSYDLLVSDYNLTVFLSGYDFNSDGDNSNDNETGRKLSVSIDWDNGVEVLNIDTLIVNE